MKLSFPKITSIFTMSMSLYSCESASDTAKKNNINPVPVPAVVAQPPATTKNKAKEFLHIALDTTLEKVADIISGEDTETMTPALPQQSMIPALPQQPS